MNIAKLEVIADEDADNIHAGDVVAYLDNGSDVWMDPFGGLFNRDEQEQFTSLAGGSLCHVSLEGVRRSRFFAAHIRVVFS